MNGELVVFVGENIVDLLILAVSSLSIRLRQNPRKIDEI